MCDYELEIFFKANYNRWLKFSKYYCQKAGFLEEANDLLNEVLAMIFEKYGSSKVLELSKAINGKCTELDLVVFKYMKANITLPTAPYRWKYHRKNTLIFDESYMPDNLFNEEGTVSKEDMIEVINKAMNNIKTTPLELAIYKHFFLEDKDLTKWVGTESISKVYKVKDKLVRKIKDYIEKNR